MQLSTASANSDPAVEKFTKVMSTKIVNVHESSVKSTVSHELTKLKKIGTSITVLAVVLVITGEKPHTGLPPHAGERVATGDNITTEVNALAGDNVITGSDRMSHNGAITHYDRKAGNCPTSYVGSAAGLDGPGPVFGVNGHEKTFQTGTVAPEDDAETGVNIRTDCVMTGVITTKCGAKSDNTAQAVYNAATDEYIATVVQRGTVGLIKAGSRRTAGG